MPVTILATGFLPVQSPDLSGVTTTPSPEKVSANARLSKENILHEIELIVNERPAVALRRSVTAEVPEFLSRTGGPQYHIVAFNTQSFSHLVHTGVQTYRFTSTNGGYAPSGNETAGCTVETSEESDQVAGGFLDGLTVSQLSQQVRGQAPSARAPARPHASTSRAAQSIALPGSQLFDGHPGISVVEMTEMPSSDKAFFEGCTVANIPDGGIQPPPLPSASSTAPGQLWDGCLVRGSSSGTGHRQLSFASELDSMTWPLVHDGGYCGSYKAFEGSPCLWSHLSGEGEAKVLCAADKDCTGIVQYGNQHFFACAGDLGGSPMNSWSAVRTFAKPAASDSVPGDQLARPALITAESAAAAALSAPTASSNSPGAAPTVGWLGPFLCVMLTYNDTVSFKNETAIRDEFFGSIGYADMLAEASWGQYKLRSSDVDFITIDTGATDPIDFSLGSSSSLVRAHQTYKDKISSRAYTRTLIFEPNQPACGSCFRASAYTPGVFSQYRGSGAQDWQTIAHVNPTPAPPLPLTLTLVLILSLRLSLKPNLSLSRSWATTKD